MDNLISDKANKPKNRYWQAIRGIAIIAVVFIHCSNLSNSDTLFTWEGIYYIFFRNIINFPVAVFFFLSGYFTNIFVKVDLKKKIKRLLVPYFMWTMLYIFLRVLMGERITAYGIINFFVFGRAAVPLYFIIALFLANLLTPILIKLIHSKARYLIFGIFGILILLQYLVYYYNIMSLKPYFRYVLFMVFYYLGIILKTIEIKVSVCKGILLLITAFILQIIETLLLYKLNLSDFVFGQTRLTAFLYAFVIIILCCSLKRIEIKSYLGRALSFLGDNSYSIFYIHYGILMLLNQLLTRIRFDFNLPLLQLIQFIVSISVSLLVTMLLRRLLGKKYSYILGI